MAIDVAYDLLHDLHQLPSRSRCGKAAAVHFKRSAPVGMRSAGGLDGTRDVDGRATADQVRMVRVVATMFEDLRAMADRYAELHADRAQLEAELEHARQDADRQRADHTAELERVRDELIRTRQDAGLWREETDRERARITNMQADADRAGDGAAPDRERAGAAAVMAEAIGSQAIAPSGQLSAHPGISWG
jgi:hypothetical protein